MTEPTPTFRLVRARLTPAPGTATKPHGSWWFAPNPGDTATTPRNAYTHGVMITCGACGFSGKIADAIDDARREDGTRGHDIDGAGQVDPALKCPACGWHAFVVLGNWVGPDENAVPTPPPARADDTTPQASLTIPGPQASLTIPGLPLELAIEAKS